MFTFMSPSRTALGVTRSLVGLVSWVAPDHAARIFGFDPERSDRFVTRLFGARDLALGLITLAAPRSALAPVAAIGIAVDAVDSVAGFDERRRGNLSTQATILGPGGALALVVLGAIVARDAAGE